MLVGDSDAVPFPTLSPLPTAQAGFEPEAACRNVDPDVFFPTGYARQHRGLVLRAKAICARCPIADACLQVAMHDGEEVGIWGGRTPAERARLRRLRLSHVRAV
jgi:WhiB family redox-sensing transcriptional regulator